MSGAFYGEGARDAYAWMRRHAPVYYDEVNALWALASYDSVLAASRDAATFSNAGGSRPKVGAMPWMIDMDGAMHHKRRKLVSSGFTPRRVRDGEAGIAAICDDLIDRAFASPECDLVRDLAAPLPLIVIGDMLGIPPDDRDDLLRWSDDLLGSLSGDQEHLAAAATAFGEFNDYAQRAIDARRADPQDDLISILVHAEIDGERLTDGEIVMESLLLLVGGDETTRHVISGGMLQVLSEPEQLAKLRADMSLLPGAIEEMLRWVSPIKNMNRTVTRDIDLAGQRLREGDQVELLYESANFDDAHFDAPERFDITRDPNDHVAFGFGAHFCLGASLARQEARVMVERLLHRAPGLRLTAEATRSQFFHTVEAMPVALA
jgi:cytochrome P450 family 142 subfamily A polypeptide 1